MELPKLSIKFQLTTPQGQLTPEGLRLLTQLGNAVSSESEDTDVEELESLIMNRVRSFVGDLEGRLEALEMATIVSPSDIADMKNRLQDVENLL